MIGLKRGIVKLSPYSPKWVQVYSKEKLQLEIAIGEQILNIQHIGSTAIPGMMAKPIIDIAVAVHDFKKAFKCVKPLKNLGYEYKGEFGIPNRHYFVKGSPRVFHLHMLEISSQEWKNHLFFRDFLLQHPDKAKKYAELKKLLAQRFSADRDAYTEGKASFIIEILQQIE
ncbi:MAG: GrpB family protein [Candidatus Heimdallarchaeota archaeon]|nr:MAG: GrpB family protein [Candidatus Heimdallarchaeota archaeon]